MFSEEARAGKTNAVSGVLTLGVISDTHGLLRPEAVAALRGTDWILHAGDFGSAEVLAAVRALAPSPERFVAVRGNVDYGNWALALPERVSVEIAGRRILMLHDRHALGGSDPGAAGYHVIISGHSHQPLVERRGGALFLNPGSAGPRRFRLPVSLAFLTIHSNTGELDARIERLL